MDTTLSLLTWRDLREWGAPEWRDAQLVRLPMVGYVRRTDGVIDALGGVVWFGKRPTASFAMREDFRVSVRSRWVHRLAIDVLEAVQRYEPAIYATAEEGVPGAREWLERLGFRETDGEYVRGISGASGSGDRICGGERRQLHHGQRPECGVAGGDGSGRLRELSSGTG